MLLGIGNLCAATYTIHMNTLGNAPGVHSRAIADWLQPLASPKSSGAFPGFRSGMPPLPPSTSLQLSTALLYSIMFIYLPAYRVLICVEHYHAVYGLDEHLKRHHGLPAARRRELRAAYAGLAIDAPKHVTLLASSSAPIAELGRAQDAFLCCQQEEDASAGSGASAAVAAGAAATLLRIVKRCISIQISSIALS
jgi:hypothetical protein